MRSIRVTSATKKSLKDGVEASVAFELTCPSGLCNPMDRMHGGAMATLADMATTMATA
jgi:acyl-coenzyme A thioesterase PaaI-like protein